MLVWEPVKDRHTFGVNGNHQFCIRLNKENKVTGLYYLTDGTKNITDEIFIFSNIFIVILLNEKIFKRRY
jgi:hypothetical protein